MSFFGGMDAAGGCAGNVGAADLEAGDAGADAVGDVLSRAISLS